MKSTVKVWADYRSEFGFVPMDLEWLGTYWTDLRPVGFDSYDEFEQQVLAAE